MSNSTPNLDLLSVSQSQKEATANNLFLAASPAMLYGRRDQTSGGLVWGYYGGTAMVAGTPTQIANGTITLAASATNYVEANPADGSVSSNTTGFTAGRTPLYSVVTGASTVTSYTDLRTSTTGNFGAGGTVKSVNTKTPDSAGNVTLAAADVGALTQTQGDARYVPQSAEGQANGVATLGSDGKVPASQLPASTTNGTVTSVDLAVPGLLYTVSGGPVTGSGTLTMALKTQPKNTVLAGPASGADATPTMRALVAADMAALLAAVNVFTKNQSVATVNLGSGVSPAIDASLSNNFKITLTANNTLVNPTNLTEGMILNFAITQDATGGRTLSYGSLYKFAGGTVPALSSAANAKDFMSCYYDGSALLCQLNKGFA